MVAFKFTIVSRKYGAVVVTAPARFRKEIEAICWFVMRDPSRAVGSQLVVGSHVGKGKDRRTRYLHRLIWELSGKAQVPRIDHADGQPLNNSEANLREATPSQQCQNRRRFKTNTSGVTGVYWQRAHKSWTARIGVDGRSRHLGYFASFQDAVRARKQAEREFHGDFMPMAEASQ